MAESARPAPRLQALSCRVEGRPRQTRRLPRRAGILPNRTTPIAPWLSFAKPRPPIHGTAGPAWRTDRHLHTPPIFPATMSMPAAPPAQIEAVWREFLARGMREQRILPTPFPTPEIR